MGLLNILSSSSLLIALITITFDLIQAQPEDNEYGMCGNPDCTEPIAYARAHSLYSPVDSYTLRLKPGDTMVVYVRNYGVKKNFFGVELLGKKGYVPQNIVREVKVLRKATFPARNPFIPVKMNDVPGASTFASPIVAASDEPQSPSSSHIESHSTSGKTAEASQSHKIPSASPSLENSVSPTIQGRVSHENNNIPGSSDNLVHISDSHPTGVPSAKLKEDHLPKSIITQYTDILTNQINKTLNSMVEHQKSQHVDSSVDIKPTESSIHDQNTHQGDQDYEATMKRMRELNININENDLNSVDFQSKFSDSLTTTTSTKLAEATSSSSFNKQSATISENVSPTEPVLLPSHSPSYSNPSEANENEQFSSQKNPVSVDHQSQTFTLDHSLVDPSSRETEIQDEMNDVNGNKGAESFNNPKLPDDYDYNEDIENESQSSKVHEDSDSILVSIVKESISKSLALNQPISPASYEQDDHGESQFLSSSDLITTSEKFSDRNFDSIKTWFSETEAGSSTVVPKNTEVKSSSSITFSMHEDEPDQNYSSSSDINDPSDNQTYTKEESLPNTISDAALKASDSSTRTSRHILGEGSIDDDVSISTGDENYAEAANLESGAGGEHHPGYFSVEAIEWAAGSFWNASTNIVYGLKAFLDLIIAWSPEPLHSTLKNMNFYGVSARAVVFTALSIVPTFLLFVLITYIQRNSKEGSITAQLCEAERKLYQSSAERNALLEENNNLREQFESAEKSLLEDRSISSEMKGTVEVLESEYKQAKLEIQSHQDKILRLSEENEDLQRKLSDSCNKYEHLSECLKTQENDMNSVSEANEKMQDELDQLSTEKQQLIASEELYKEKISSLEQSCKQLLQEAEIWNARVSELTEQVYSEAAAKKEAEKLIQSKDSEIETLKTVVSSMEALTNTKESEDGDKKSLEESMQLLMDAGKIQIQLKKTEELSESLSEKLKQERNKVLEMEVELLESKSEVDKLKVHYNQALQDKAEAQTKLDVLTKYFKDKELQLQKELGVHEAFRQRKEEDATQAERRIHLIEEENSSYKFQVATLKQEIEETERNLKNQIANQEKKAHENWLAARNAERKMEEMKQENTQLRQRLTLLEREQEKWSTSSQGDVIRPVPQRISEQGHDVLSSSDGNIPMEFLPRHIPPPPRHPDDMIPPFPPPAHMPMPLPGRPILPPPSHSPRPLPPPMMPPYIPRPPFDPVLSGMPPHRPVPWGTMSEKRFELERRKMSSDFDSPPSRRNQTPPHSESLRRSVSPTEFNSRSRSSSPSVPLPDFHNNPPRMGRPDMPPPPPHMRFVGGPPHLMHRRDFNSGASPFRDGNRAERLHDEGSSSSSRTRNFSQPRQASEEEV